MDMRSTTSTYHYIIADGRHMKFVILVARYVCIKWESYIHIKGDVDITHWRRAWLPFAVDMKTVGHVPCMI